ncbi:DUF2461 domain-containing protein [Flindersiella endophytica]
MGRFKGWPERAFDVLLRLEGDPTMEERRALREQREQLVRQPMIALMQDIADLDPVYDDFFVWGFDKLLWPWQRQRALFLVGDYTQCVVTFDLDGLVVRGFRRSQRIDVVRAAIASPAGAELVDVLETLRAKGYEIAGEVTKRVPRDYDRDHKRADLLRHRTLTATRYLGCDDWLHTEEARDRVFEALEELRPFVRWLQEHATCDR